MCGEARSNRQARATRCGSGTSPRDIANSPAMLFATRAGWSVPIESRTARRSSACPSSDAACHDREDRTAPSLAGSKSTSRLKLARRRRTLALAGISHIMSRWLIAPSGRNTRSGWSISHDLERNVSTVVGPRVLSLRKLAHDRRVCPYCCTRALKAHHVARPARQIARSGARRAAVLASCDTLSGVGCRVWVATENPEAIHVFDVDRPDRIARSIVTSARVTGAVDLEWLWTAEFDTGVLERRTHDGDVVAHVSVVERPTGMVQDAEHVWINPQDSTDPVMRVDKASLLPTATRWNDFGHVVHADSDSIWLRESCGFGQLDTHKN